MNTYTIKRGDTTLDVEATDEFKRIISRTFNIHESEITEAHVHKFICDALTNAIAKDEQCA